MHIVLIACKQVLASIPLEKADIKNEKSENNSEHLPHFSLWEMSQCPVGPPVEPLTSQTCQHLTSGRECVCAAVSGVMQYMCVCVCVSE